MKIKCKTKWNANVRSPCEAHVSRSRSKIHKKLITCHVACHTFLI